MNIPPLPVPELKSLGRKALKLERVHARYRTHTPILTNSPEMNLCAGRDVEGKLGGGENQAATKQHEPKTQPTAGRRAETG